MFVFLFVFWPWGPVLGEKGSLLEAKTIVFTRFSSKYGAFWLMSPPTAGIDLRGLLPLGVPKTMFFLSFPLKIANLEAGGQREYPLGGQRESPRPEPLEGIS